MDDMISRQAAIDAICGECQGNCIPCEHYPCGEIKALEQLTSIQPERKSGKWIVLDIRDYAQRPTGRKVGKCPFCGYLTGEFRRWREAYHELTNFCPNCGADMRGKHDERVEQEGE